VRAACVCACVCVCVCVYRERYAGNAFRICVSFTNLQTTGYTSVKTDCIIVCPIWGTGRNIMHITGEDLTSHLQKSSCCQPSSAGWGYHDCGAEETVRTTLSNRTQRVLSQCLLKSSRNKDVFVLTTGAVHPTRATL
jgi:hypothetical protein